MSREEWLKLKNSGMMWEVFPEFNGLYDHDLEVFKDLEEQGDRRTRRIEDRSKQV